MSKFISLSAFAVMIGIGLIGFNMQAMASTMTVSGKSLFQTNCSACHGVNARGVVGPNIVGKKASDIERALKTVPMMAGLKSIITKSDAGAISGYLNSAAIAGTGKIGKSQSPTMMGRQNSMMGNK